MDAVVTSRYVSATDTRAAKITATVYFDGEKVASIHEPIDYTMSSVAQMRKLADRIAAAIGGQPARSWLGDCYLVVIPEPVYSLSYNRIEGGYDEFVLTRTVSRSGITDPRDWLKKRLEEPIND